jgi:hypothetical protein
MLAREINLKQERNVWISTGKFLPDEIL